MKIAPDFLPSLSGCSLTQIEASSDVIFILDERFTLRGFNTAWENFAKENNGSKVLEKFGIGCSVSETFPEPLKGFYVRLYQRALFTGRRIDSEYECSSDKIYRKFFQSIYPLQEKAGFLVYNHLEIEKPHEETPAVFSAKHRNADGIIIQCCHCRCIKDHSQNDKWDWIPEFIREIPPQTSHGFCSRCAEFYYPGLTADPVQKND